MIKSTHSLSTKVIPKMPNQVSDFFHICLLFTCVMQYSTCSMKANIHENRKVHIVYMGQNTLDDMATTSLHTNILTQVLGSDASKHLLQRYTKSFHGFSANLTREEAKKISEMEGVLSVFPSKNNKLATTTSWDFLGFPLNVKRSTSESDIIIAVIDTGIWPESPSFNDHGYGPPPAKWKGTCEVNFPCNNKVIGARYFKADGSYNAKDFRSPRDAEGHGTHTASTAAGNLVRNANLLGLRSGTARGGVPRARIAVYKVCWIDGSCTDVDVLSAFDAAIADGVDMITISVGASSGRELLHDIFALGAFHAMKEGILTVQSASNEGPKPQTTSSVAPWIISVAASTKNPDLVTKIKLGNGIVVDGISANPFTSHGTSPLVYAGDVPNTMANFTGSISRFCKNNSLDKNLVKGKIILCDDTTTGEVEMSAGAIGSIMRYSLPYFEVIGSYPLPVSVVDSDQADNIMHYIRSTESTTENANADILKSDDFKDASTPYVASFSSRGPNPVYHSILKPDITAPGVRILAAWSPVAPISNADGDKRVVPFNFASGTSMACPHVTGIAAYIKTFHPTWSPAAIKSALMTTASPMSSLKNALAEFAYGAGHVNPLKALDPGLVYDAHEVDYVRFLCQEGFSSKDIRIITGVKDSTCSPLVKESVDLNYPTFVIPTLRKLPVDVNLTRTVTNVGPMRSTYKALLTQPDVSGFDIHVEPNVLQFKEIGQKISFTLSVQAKIDKLDSPIVSGALIWDDGVHQVRSPIVVHVP